MSLFSINHVRLTLFAEDFCASNPCQNGGTCDNNIDGTDFECVCDGAYKGKNCETKIIQGALIILGLSIL